MNKVKHIETWGNGMKIYAADEGAIPVVRDGTILVKGNSTYEVGTCSGFYTDGFGKGFDAIDADRPLCRDGHKPVWINARSVGICAGTHPDKGKYALEIAIGDTVWLEGNRYKIAARMNNNLGFEPVA